ncbi:MFS transporter [Rossellomorea aquimaris]|uniref:MFS transporter n=1 Tax=Rossellomorea aquimaris TaxID=189382 RepID=UPI001CD6DA50|nr:MFS transporter [Rossellomorea aquimaris]MCA1056420.1 MFS transporter [Rossellomorea aquimaris]
MEERSFKSISVLLVMMGVMVASNIYTFIPIYGDIAASIGIPQHSVVWAGSSFSFFYACGLLIFANIADRFGKREILLFGMIISTLSTALVTISFDSFSLSFTRGLQGFCLGSFAPVAFSYTYDLFNGKKRTLLLALINSGFLFAGILGQLLSEGITRVSHWGAVFLFFSAVYLFLFFSGKRILPATLPPKRGIARHPVAILYSLLIHKQLMILYLIVFTLLSSFVFYYDSLNRFLHDDGTLLLYIRLMGLVGVSLSLFTGRLLDALGSFKTLFIGFSIAVTSIGVSFMYLITPMYLLLMISSILFVSAISLLIPTVITLIGDISGKERSQALSLYSFILLGGTSLAPLFAMKLTYIQSLSLLLICFILNLILGAFLSILRREEPKKESPGQIMDR